MPWTKARALIKSPRLARISGGKAFGPAISCNSDILVKPGMTFEHHQTGPRHSSRRHRYLRLLPAARNQILRPCTSATWREDQLVGQRRPLDDVPGRLYQ